MGVPPQNTNLDIRHVLREPVVLVPDLEGQLAGARSAASEMALAGLRASGQPLQSSVFVWRRSERKVAERDGA